MSSTRDAVPVRFFSESATGVGPAALEIGGHDVSRITRGVVIRSVVGEVATVTVETFALGGMDITLPAAVVVNMLPLEHGHMDVTTLEDGTVRYVFVRGDRDA